MKKKILYPVIFAVVIVLGYLNYFREEPGIKEVEEVVETTNVAYETSGYFIEAAKQFDDLKTNNTNFEKASAKFKDMVLSGENVLLDSARNLFLKNNIVGKSGEEWEFFTEKLDYDQLKDAVTSNVGVKAVNKLENIIIKGKNFKTNSKFDFIDLAENVEIINGDTELFGDIGRYTAENKIITLSNNGKYKTKNKDGKEISGTFKNGKYDSDKKLLELYNSFTINYDGITLNGTKMWYNDLNKGFLIPDNPVITAGGYEIFPKEIKNPDGDNIIDIVGEITGTNGETSFRGDKGYYNTDEKKLYVEGNIVITSKAGERVEAEKMIYDTNTKDADFIGKNNKVIYTFNDRRAEASKFVYNSENKMIHLDEGYTYEDNLYRSIGKKLDYNSDTGEGVIFFGNLVTKEKNEKARGEKILFNSKKKDYIIEKNAEINNGEYLFKSEKLDYMNSTGFAHLTEPFTITGLKDRSVISGTKGEYNIGTQDFISNEKVTYVRGKEKVSGDDFAYNLKTEKGKITKNVFYEDKAKNLTLTSDSGSFQKDKYVEVNQNVKITTAKEEIFAEKGRYNLETEIITIPGKIDFNTKDMKTRGTVYDGIFNVKENTLTGKNLNAVTDKNETISSNKAVYYTEKDTLNLIGNVKISDSNSVLTSEDMDYNTKTRKAVSNTSFKLIYDKTFTVTGNDGVAEMASEKITGNTIKIVSDKNEEFYADKIDGNMKEMRFDFIGNAKGRMLDTDKETGKVIPVTYTGDFVRVYFKKENGTYKAVRIEGRDDSIITREGQKFYSDYIEMDLSRNIVYAGKNNKVILNDERGKTVITGDVLNGNTRTNIMEGHGNVVIVNTGNDGKVTTLKGQESIMDNNNSIVEMLKDVTAENDELILNADRAIYNKVTNKVKAFGKVLVNYKMKK